MNRDILIGLRHGGEFRRCLDELDVVGAMRLWQHVSPHLPQPSSGAETLIMLHHARTVAKSVDVKKRAYSHRWLVDRGLPSGLPDELRPRAERMYPSISEGVGYAMKTSSPLFRPIVPLITRAVSDAILECYSDKKTDPPFVRSRMKEAREITIKKLLGNTTLGG